MTMGAETIETNDGMTGPVKVVEKTGEVRTAVESVMGAEVMEVGVTVPVAMATAMMAAGMTAAVVRAAGVGNLPDGRRAMGQSYHRQDESKTRMTQNIWMVRLESPVAGGVRITPMKTERTSETKQPIKMKKATS